MLTQQFFVISCKFSGGLQIYGVVITFNYQLIFHPNFNDPNVVSTIQLLDVFIEGGIWAHMKISMDYNRVSQVGCM